MRSSQPLRALASAAVLSGFFAGAAYARDAAEQNSVDAIIITATKREQSLRDVPVVVTAVSGQLMQDAGVKDIKDLTILTPGLVVTSTSNETITTARIRGVGAVGDNPGQESSVGVVIDGVYSPRNGVSFGAQGEVTVGDYGARGVSASVTGPITGDDPVAGRLFVATRQRDGYPNPAFNAAAVSSMAGTTPGHTADRV